MEHWPNIQPRADVDSAWRERARDVNKTGRRNEEHHPLHCYGNRCHIVAKNRAGETHMLPVSRGAYFVRNA